MKKLVCCVLILLFTGACVVFFRFSQATKSRASKKDYLTKVFDLPAEQLEKSTEKAQIEVTGDNQFQLQIARALNVLEHSSPTDYATVTNSIRAIEMGQYTGWSQPDATVCTIGKTSVVNSVTWTAGILVRQAVHAQFYKEARVKDTNVKIPVELWKGWRHQKAAAAASIIAMRQIEAPIHEVEYLEQQFRKWYPESQSSAEAVPTNQNW